VLESFDVNFGPVHVIGQESGQELQIRSAQYEHESANDNLIHQCWHR